MKLNLRRELFALAAAMFRFLAIIGAAVVMGALIGDTLVQAVAWMLAFLSLVIPADLLRSHLPRLPRRTPRA